MPRACASCSIIALRSGSAPASASTFTSWLLRCCPAFGPASRWSCSRARGRTGWTHRRCRAPRLSTCAFPSGSSTLPGIGWGGRPWNGSPERWTSPIRPTRFDRRAGHRRQSGYRLRSRFSRSPRQDARRDPPRLSCARGASCTRRPRRGDFGAHRAGRAEPPRRRCRTDRPCRPGAPPAVDVPRSDRPGPILFVGTIEPRKNLPTLFAVDQPLVARPPAPRRGYWRAAQSSTQRKFWAGCGRAPPCRPGRLSRLRQRCRTSGALRVRVDARAALGPRRLRTARRRGDAGWGPGHRLDGAGLCQRWSGPRASPWIRPMRPVSRRQWNGCWRIRTNGGAAPRPAASRRGCSRGRRARPHCWRRIARPSPGGRRADGRTRLEDWRGRARDHRRRDGRRAGPGRIAAALDRPPRRGSQKVHPVRTDGADAPASSRALWTCAFCLPPAPAPGGSRVPCGARTPRAAGRVLRSRLHRPARLAGAAGADDPRRNSAHPEWFRPRERIPAPAADPALAARARFVVFTDSTFSRNEILRHIPLIRPGPGDCTGVSPRHRQVTRLSAPDPLVLFVGSVFNRRRLPQLIAAFARHVRLAEGAAGDRRLESDLAAPAARIDRGGSWCGRAGRGSQLRGRGRARGPLQPGVDIRVSSIRIRVDTVGSARCRRAHSRSIHRWLARSTAHRPPTCLPPQTSLTAALLRAALDGGAGTSATLRHADAVLRRYSWDEAATRTLASIERTVRRP